MENEKFVSALRLSLLFGVSRASIYRMADAGIIPSVRIGSKLGARRFNESAVRNAINRQSASCSGIAGADEVNAGRTRKHVECDDDCGAFEEPESLEEYKDTLEHYKHCRLACGCSHGN